MARYCSAVRGVVHYTRDDQWDGPRVPGGPEDPEGKMSKTKAEGDGGWGTGPSVLLAISQRNMWVRKEDHAGTLSGPLLIRGSAGQMYFTFPRAAGIRRFVRPCSRNNDWQDDLGPARRGSEVDRCGM